MTKRRTLFVARALLWLAAFGAASLPKGAAQTATVDLKNPALIARGGQLFAKSCAVGYCHGSEGRAARGPQLRDREWDPRRVHDIIAAGVLGTSMPSWSALFPDEDIWALTSYIMSLSTTRLDVAAAVIEVGPAAAARSPRSAEAEKGRELFFDLTNQKRCSICHQLGSEGTAVGPDLAASAEHKSAQELLRDIVEPGASIAEGYEETDIATNGADRIAGIKKEETKQFIRLYDTSSIPPPLRTIYREQIHAVSTAKRSSMPGDYGRLYSPEELQAIVAYLKSGNY